MENNNQGDGAKLNQNERANIFKALATQRGSKGDNSMVLQANNQRRGPGIQPPV